MAAAHSSEDGLSPLRRAYTGINDGQVGLELITLNTIDEADFMHTRDLSSSTAAEYSPNSAEPSRSSETVLPSIEPNDGPAPQPTRPRGTTVTWAPTATSDARAPLGPHAASTDPLVRPLTEVDGAQHLGTAWPSRKKWLVLTAICIVQLSMNFNASVYASAFAGVQDRYGASLADARWGQMLFLVLYGIGSELWAPWSEEWGRRGVLQGSLALVNLTQVLCAAAPSLGALLAGRALGGLFSAGGSVTLGVVADLWGADAQQFAVASVVLASVAGSALGPVAGGFLRTRLPLAWIFWAQLIFGAVAQALHLCVPETRASILLDREARRQRQAGAGNVRGPGELQADGGLTARKVLRIWARPFVMFATEPIVLLLSLLSGFSDALIFTFLESFRPVLVQWGFDTAQVGLAFTAILIGYLLAYLFFLPFIHRDVHRRKHNADVPPESRLWLLLWLAPLEALGLFGFAWTSSGPPIPWAVPLFFAMLIAIANYAIYMATIDYMVASYGPYSASATGGNALARDLLAGFAALYSGPFFEKFPNYTLQLPSTILGVLAVVVAIPIYVFYRHGPAIRAKSTFAVSLEREREDKAERAQKRRQDRETA